MSRAVFHRMLAPGVALGFAMLVLSACSAGPMGGETSDAVGPSGPAAGGNTDLATQQACRQRVNEMYEIRDRGEIYSPTAAVNTPYSGNSYVGVPSRGLSNQFAYEQSLAECERNARNGTGGTGAVDIPPGPPAAAKSP